MLKKAFDLASQTNLIVFILVVVFVVAVTATIESAKKQKVPHAAKFCCLFSILLTPVYTSGHITKYSSEHTIRS